LWQLAALAEKHDLVVCSDEIQEASHLHVVPSMGSVSLRAYSDQVFRFPNLMDVHNVFLAGGYDRIVCSTEAPMGAIALYLKQAFNVPTYFYMHTDWLDYAQRMTDLDVHSMDRVRRLIRALYRSFDGIFVLNTEHRDWLASRAIGIKAKRIYLTAHWSEGSFAPPQEFPRESGIAPVLLFAGRLSEEKGVLDLPEIFAQVLLKFPQARLRIAGTGVSEAKLREVLPKADYLGWVGPEALAKAYGEADFLILPSRFDTFGCVVIEAMACGTPVAAYNTKGPRDIIQHGINGVLADSARELGLGIASCLEESETHSKMRQASISRAFEYDKHTIMSKMLEDLGMPRNPNHFLNERSSI
jgi:glycosyltransferase involved in cell wall biosynthesis